MVGKKSKPRGNFPFWLDQGGNLQISDFTVMLLLAKLGNKTTDTDIDMTWDQNFKFDLNYQFYVENTVIVLTVGRRQTGSICFSCVYDFSYVFRFVSPLLLIYFKYYHLFSITRHECITVADKTFTIFCTFVKIYFDLRK